MKDLSGQMAAAGAAASLQRVKGEIVTQTLDKLNSPGSGGKAKKGKFGHGSMSDTYNLSKSVLSAAYEGKGTIIDSKR
ncbi:MAG: hypothetical protein FWG04_05925 [Desulfovibrionaceae bacterium]|nr:hypothetical protein [Desulfovibrionaceae bacterium]